MSPRLVKRSVFQLSLLGMFDVPSTCNVHVLYICMMLYCMSYASTLALMYPCKYTLVTIQYLYIHNIYVYTHQFSLVCICSVSVCTCVCAAIYVQYNLLSKYLG